MKISLLMSDGILYESNNVKLNIKNLRKTDQNGLFYFAFEHGTLYYDNKRGVAYIFCPYVDNNIRKKKIEMSNMFISKNLLCN